MESNTLCVLAAPLVNWVTDWLKRFPFIKAHPKLVAFLISFILPGITGIGIIGPAITLKDFVQCVLIQLGGAVAFHEIVDKTANKLLRPV